MNVIKKFFDNLKESHNKSVLVSFIKKEKKLLDYLQPIDETIPALITKRLSFSYQSNEYKNLVKEIQDLTEETKQHNSIIDKIDSAKKAFNLDEYLKNPDNVPNDYLLSLKGILTEINAFPKKEKNYKEFANAISDFLTNSDSIKEQYSSLITARAFLNEERDYYLDERIVEGIKQKTNLLLEPILASKKPYYSASEFNNINSFISNKNESFIKKHLNDSIFDNIGGRSLDFDQRKTILCDSVSNLTIAGAGCGKTTTICGKVKYLLETKKANPDEILLLSYSKNSANDLKKKISEVNDQLEVRTFHALGLSILTEALHQKMTVEDQFDAIIERYFREKLSSDQRSLYQILTYYSLYLKSNTQNYYADLGAQFTDLRSKDFQTIKNQLSDLADPSKVTIQKEVVKSYDELAIANFYFINGIRYEYEKPYAYNVSSSENRQYLPDFYLLDYKVYHEHYGVNKEGHTPQYPLDEEKKYLQGIDWKRKIHARYETTCIETYSYEFTDGTIFTKLTEELAKNHIPLKPLNANQVYKAMNSIYQKQDFKSLISLIKSFINLYKAKYSNSSYFELLKKEAVRFKDQYNINRACMFLDICKNIYEYYLSVLKEENKIDFDDMINQSMQKLPLLKDYKYKYILVDEFQDISYSRFQFLKALINHGSSKLFAVGDDWQAIYRFSGCDLNIFLDFKNNFVDSTIHFLSHTHRNSQEIQNIIEPFITRNLQQIKKHLVSDKHQKDPIRLLYYNYSNRQEILVQALRAIDAMNPKASVLLLGRNNCDLNYYLNSELTISSKGLLKHHLFPNLSLSFKTIHGSKGLEADYVIVLNNSDGRNGFPSTIEDDEILSLVLSEKSNFPLDEERRLFYVAITRTRNVTFLLVPLDSQSVFIQEIEPYIYIVNPQIKHEEEKPILCPKCHSGHLVLRNNGTFYGCSNYPYCDYTNRHVEDVKKNRRCPVCGDFLVWRKDKSGHYFLACSSYPKCTYTSKRR
ncbi:MAG: UvrD-helicase domain-containing protein [Bacilli bacterium]